MPLDRRASRWLNGLCSAVVIAVVGGVGWLAYAGSQADRPIEPPPVTSKLREFLKSARQAIRDGKAKDAKAYFEEAIRLDPTHEFARFEYSRFLLDQGSPKEAWTQLSSYVPKALRAGRPVTGDASALAWYGDLAAQYGDAKLGDEACRATLKANWEEFESGDWDEYRKNSQGARLRALAHCAAGGGLIFGQPTPDRLVHARRAVQLDPKLPLAQLGLAHALIEAKQAAASRKPLNDAVRLIGPEKVQMRVIAAHLLYDAGEKAKSLALLRDAARRAPAADTGLASMIGYDLMRAGQKDEAMAMAVRAKPLADARRTRVYVGLAMLLAQLGKREDALAMIRKAEPFAPVADRAQVREAAMQIERNEGVAPRVQS